MRKVKSKVLGIAVVLMAAAMLATPFIGTVMAKSPNKVPAAAVIYTTGFDPATLDIRVTDDGIDHIIYLEMWGIIELYQGGNPTPTIVEWVDTCEGLYNPRSNKGTWRFDEVWTIDGSDAFVGTDHVKVEGMLIDPISMRSHIVLHGIGDYEGQVLNLWFDSGALIGTWLKP